MEEKHDQQRLMWTHRNRLRRDRCRSAGAVVAGFAQSLAASDGNRLRAIAEALGRVVDDEFRRSCRVGGLKGATLWIHVNPSAPVSWFRMRWQGALPGLLKEVWPVSRIECVVFRASNDGQSIGDMAAPTLQAANSAERRRDG